MLILHERSGPRSVLDFAGEREREERRERERERGLLVASWRQLEVFKSKIQDKRGGGGFSFYAFILSNKVPFYLYMFNCFQNVVSVL